jgi:autotransporter-associated beta strand protein
LGAGGDVFVTAGASLTIVGGALSSGSVVGGGARRGAVGGQAFGSGIFLQGDESMTLAPAIGTTERIYGVIADQTGSGGTGANAGAGSLILNGAGALDLIAANTFTGGVTIDRGVLELANTGAAGSGGIDFAATTGEVEDAASANLANTISGFKGSDKIDFSTVAFATGDHAVDKAGNVSIETSAGKTVATFDVSGTYTSANFRVSADPSGHLLVGFVAASPADLLGRHDSQFPMPIQEMHSGVFGLDSLLSPLLSAETYAGVLADRHDGNVGARAALGAGAGWNDPTGHGPGPDG